ncbi:intercellular adhesion molecule 5 [Labrus mixtus]|uniref:intercellular adhesion molecule 5 n=1 Tax=Labrus mixtus TaxID=508554 RepID=UPI0029C040A9|nr:intercellular adhesion molecule 5 [Labrus mixtus]
MQPLRTLCPLMLMILLCDSSCPPESNPLTLDPPVVVGELGETVGVNCSSVKEDHYGMYWRTRNTDSKVEEDNSFIAESLQLSDWNTTAECKIKLNEISECSKELEIIVYKNPDLSMYPTKYLTDLVEGKPFELQCDIIEVAPVQKLTVRWYKGKQIIKTDTFSNTTKRPVDESSTLMVNISRGDHGAQFRCEAQLDFGPHRVQTPVISKPHQVSVLYSPAFKRNTVSDYYILKEGVNVSLLCEAEGNPPPVFSWTRDGLNLSETTDHLNLTRVENSSIYNCTASNRLGSITKRISVQAIKVAKMPVPEVMTTPEATTPTPTYPEVSTSAAPDTSTPTTSESPTPATEASTPATEASTPAYTEASTAQGCLLVLTPPEIVVKFGDPATVNCSTSAPDAYVMGWESTVGGTGVVNPPAVTWRVKKLEQWTIEPKCFVSTEREQCIVTPKVTLYKTPDMVSISVMNPGPMVEGKDFSLICNISNVAPVRNLKIQWYRGAVHVDKQTINNTIVTPLSVSSTLRITPRRGFDQSEFRCIAELHLGPYGPRPVPTMTSLPYIADVHYLPIFKESYIREIILAQGENVTFNCTAEGNPSPKMQWKFPSAVNVIETTGGRYRNISIIGATSTNAGVYICNATNDIGTVTRSVTVRMRSKTSAGPSWFIWVIVILCVVVLLCIIVVILQHRQKKNGQYSFVLSKATDDIPMTDKPEA